MGNDIKEQQELQVLLTAPEFRKYNTHTIFLDFGLFFQFFMPVVSGGEERFCVTVTGLFSEAMRLGISRHQRTTALTDHRARNRSRWIHSKEHARFFIIKRVAFPQGESPRLEILHLIACRGLISAIDRRLPILETATSCRYRLKWQQRGSQFGPRCTSSAGLTLISYKLFSRCEAI
jgi:hypothetical protein